MTNYQELLEQAKLNWTVSKEPLQTVRNQIEVPQTFALLREDTQSILGTCGIGYEVYQNHELMELLHRISNQTGLGLHSAGCFDEGKRVWIQLKSNDLNLPGGDRVEGFFTGLNSFDKSRSLAFGPAFTTISCRNTWQMAYEEVQSKVRHTASLRPTIEDILSKIDALLKQESQTFEEIQWLGNFNMDEETELMVLASLFDLEKDGKIIPVDELSTYKMNKISQFYDDLAIEVASKGDNLWGLFNGVTRYTTHSMNNGKDNSKAKMFGDTGNKERAIFSSLVQLASV